jgi:capsular exopolysaccharide synthesis family protein
MAESFRLLRANLDLIRADQPFKTIMVTSCDKGLGKSSISANLATVMAQGERKVLLVDADLRNSNIHNLLDLPNELGLSDVLQKDVNVFEALQKYDGGKSEVITGGTPPFYPSELLGSMKMNRILSELRDASDVVIIDAPPLFVSDAVILSSKVDGILMVAQLGSTRRKRFKATLEQLARTGARVVGIVLIGAGDRSIAEYGPYLQMGIEEINMGDQMQESKMKKSSLRTRLGFLKAEKANERSVSNNHRKEQVPR